MPIFKKNPVTPGQRFHIQNRAAVDGFRPVRGLTKSKCRSSGRNCYGRITSRRRGGGHKRLLRVIDFKRGKMNVPATVQRIEYDPGRSATLALLSYRDGAKSYVLAPENVKCGHHFVALNERPEEFEVGMSMPLSFIPASVKVHAVELLPGGGAKLARSAGSFVQLLGVDGDRATLKLPSGEIRFVNAKCSATIGVVGNSEHGQRSLGKAGRNRWLGRRPRVRGVAMNPVDHPMGGGEGKSSGGHPVSPWGQFAKGFITRHRSKNAHTQILVRRNGRKVRKG